MQNNNQVEVTLEQIEPFMQQMKGQLEDMTDLLNKQNSTNQRERLKHQQKKYKADILEDNCQKLEKDNKQLKEIIDKLESDFIQLTVRQQLSFQDTNILPKTLEYHEALLKESNEHMQFFQSKSDEVSQQIITTVQENKELEQQLSQLNSKTTALEKNILEEMDKILNADQHQQIYELEKKIKEIKEQNESIKGKKSKIKEEYDEKIKDKAEELKDMKENFNFLMNEIENDSNSKGKRQRRRQKTSKQKKATKNGNKVKRKRRAIKKPVLNQKQRIKRNAKNNKQYRNLNMNSINYTLFH